MLSYTLAKKFGYFLPYIDWLIQTNSAQTLRPLLIILTINDKTQCYERSILLFMT